MRVLIVEDEAKLAGLLRRGLQEEGHAADVAARGEDALWMARARPYDAIVLDVMLPDLDGFSICRSLRDAEIWTPVLFLTARDALEDRVRGLDAGADDYSSSPSRFPSSSPASRGDEARPDREANDPRGRIAAAGSGCTPRMARRDRARAVREGVRPPRGLHAPSRSGPVRSVLLEAAWDMAYENRSNVIDVYVRYLREKIDRPFGCGSLETVRGVGYRLSSERC